MSPRVRRPALQLVYKEPSLYYRIIKRVEQIASRSLGGMQFIDWALLVILMTALLIWAYIGSRIILNGPIGGPHGFISA